MACCQVGGFDAWHDEGLVCLSYEPLVAFIPSWGHSQPSSPGRMWASQGSRVRFPVGPNSANYSIGWPSKMPPSQATHMAGSPQVVGNRMHPLGYLGWRIGLKQDIITVPSKPYPAPLRGPHASSAGALMKLKVGSFRRVRSWRPSTRHWVGCTNHSWGRCVAWEDTLSG